MARELATRLRRQPTQAAAANCRLAAAKKTLSLHSGPPTGDEYLENRQCDEAVLLHTSQGVCLLLFLLGRAVAPAVERAICGVYAVFY